MMIQRTHSDVSGTESEANSKPAVVTAGRRVLVILMLSLVIVVCGGLLYASGCWAVTYARHVLKIPSVKLPTLAQASSGVRIFDRHDHYICTVFADRDKFPVPLEKMSPNIRHALLSAEDHLFYKHHGLDYVAIARASYANWRAKRTVEGASTLTQQLAGNLFLDRNDRSITRKLKESFIAWDIESAYSKPKILETYLNEVYFGSGVHGIERAAEQYFSKPASMLSINESAFLAGLIRSPTVLGCAEHRKLAFARRDEILAKMVKYGYISASEFKQAKTNTLCFKSGGHRLLYPHYIVPVLEELSKNIEPDQWNHGYKIYTNLDVTAQRLAEHALDDGIRHAPKGIDQGALACICVKDGAILALVGGVGDYAHSQWNRALHPHTAGSSFKPFVYLSGLITGTIGQNTLLEDAPMMLETEGTAPWTPKNFDGRYKGWITCRDALAYSRNICAARVGLASGLDNVAQTARLAGITSPLPLFPSLTLGSCAVTPLEMATAYSTLARSGTFIRPQLIRRIETETGNVVRDFHCSPSQTLPQEKCAEIVDMMQDVVRRGTGTMARLPGIPVAGKTGTADKGKDIWFVGFTPDTVTAVWGGNDKNQPVAGAHVTGGTVMAHIWHEYMSPFVKLNRPRTLAFMKPEFPLTNKSAEYIQQLAANEAAATARSLACDQSGGLASSR